MDQNNLPTIEEGELETEQKLHPELELHLVGIKNTSKLLGRVIEAFPPTKVHEVSNSMKVSSALLVKIANDLRTIAILTSKGYAIQAATIASSLYESAYMIAYIGEDEELALKWIEHEERARMFVSVKNMTIGAMKNLGHPNPEDKADKEFNVYRQLCMVKHGNPLFQKAHSFIFENNEVVASPGPMISEDFIRVSWFSIENAIHLTCSALQSYINHQINKHVTTEIVDAYKDVNELYEEIHSRGVKRFNKT